MDVPREGTYRVDLFDKFEDVDARVGDGRKWMSAVSEFYAKRSALEKEYSKKLLALVKATSETDFG